MIAPPPFKLKCPQCGHSKIVKPKSDVINPMDYFSVCSKCKEEMKREELGGIYKLFTKVFK